jgi:SAM-dependent methyltransferase
VGPGHQHRGDTPVYGHDVTEVYDLFYRGRGKDFGAEAAAVARVIRSRKPDVSSVLDVGCGTGEHLRSLGGQFDQIAGLEMSPAMCELARDKLPGVPVHQGDMREFDLGPTFDAVCCLTSTLGYMSTVDELGQAVAAMARQLVPGGVLVIDPWWFPDQYRDGHVADDLVRSDGTTIARVSHSRRADEPGQSVRNEAHYLVADGRGVRHFRHVQTLTLFSRAAYLGAIERAGCVAEHLDDEAEFADRGLFVGVLR